MLEGFCSGLFTSWVLTGFDINIMIIEVMQPITSIEVTKSHYYIAFGLIGAIGGAFTRTVRVVSK